MLRNVCWAARYEDLAVRLVVEGFKNHDMDCVSEMASAMADALLIEKLEGSDVTLIPVPSHDGSLVRNRVLCDALAWKLRGRIDPGRVVRVNHAVLRLVPLPMPTHHMKRAKIPFTSDDHVLARTTASLLKVTGAVYLVDDVSTTGSILEACAKVLPDCRAVVYAKAVPQ